jgi:hypothetical protein
MGPKDIKVIDKGFVGTLPDGKSVNVRTTSSSGQPTLEVIDGKNSTAVRYEN